ncbi:MAG: FAD:protein FMN transferase, partial [Planctomycetaceae bacterium]|nr:FAD:protein FMN transferase [Planctomycetaceae bacterium]
MKRSLYSHILRHIQAVIWFLVFTGGGIVAGGEELQRYEFSQVHMGVPLSISVYAPDEALANKGAEAAFQRVEELDALLSDYKIDSELNQLSLEKPHGIPHEVSQDLFCVLNAAKMVSDQSDGAFDVTVGPIVKLWRKARRQKKLPETEELKARLGAVDYRLIRLDQKGQKVTLTRPGMRLDLGGIAKGYAADQALLVLKSHGLSQVLLDFGGDLVVGDPPPGKDFWTIAVAPLKREEGRENYQFIDLKNGSVATSGDAFQYVEIADVRYS